MIEFLIYGIKMDVRRRILGIVILPLFAITVLVNCTTTASTSYKKPCYEVSNIPLVETLNDFSKLIEDENINDLILTIYYLNPLILSRGAYCVDDIITHDRMHKFVIVGSELKRNIDLFKKFIIDSFIPVEIKSFLNARIYYVFETNKGQKIFDVVMWGFYNNSIFINGYEMEENEIFYDAIIPFLPEDLVKYLEMRLGKIPYPD